MSSTDKQVWIGISLTLLVTLSFWIGFAVGKPALCAIKTWVGHVFG
jgi:hypothetical protein